MDENGANIASADAQSVATENVDLTNTQSDVNTDALTDTTVENTQPQQEVSEPEQPKDPLDTIPEYYELVSKTGQLAEDANDFQEIFKKAGLTKRQAQAMYEAYNLKGNDIAEQFKQAIAQKQDEDMKTVQQDKELGGVNLKNTKMYIGKAMDKFGSPELRTKLQQAGFGNDPDFVRFVARVGKAFSNDEFVGGHGTNGRAEDSISKAKRMYPKSPELWR